MLKLFRKQSRQVSPMYSVWSKLTSVIQAKQRWWAAWLERKTRLWSKGRWQAVLIVFCTGAFIICSWMICNALVNADNVISVQQIIKPRHIIPIESHASNPQETLLYLQQLKQHLESLKASNKSSFEDLIKREPLLLDSLNGLIELYNEQSK